MKKVATVVVTARHSYDDLECKVNKKILEISQNGDKVISIIPLYRSSGTPAMTINNIIYEHYEPAYDGEDKKSAEDCVREVAVVKVTAKKKFEDLEEVVNKKIEELYQQGRTVVTITPFYKTTAPASVIYHIVCNVDKEQAQQDYEKYDKEVAGWKTKDEEIEKKAEGK